MRESFGGILVIALFIGFIILLVGWTTADTDTDCKERFGNQWDGRYSTYSGSKCVDRDGNVKYL